MKTIADEIDPMWHKLAGALLLKFAPTLADGTRDVRLTMPEIQEIDGQAIVVSHEQQGRVLRIRIMPQAEADRLAAEFQRGGL